MHLCHAEECITSFCFCCSVSDSLSLVLYLSHNLGLTPPRGLRPTVSCQRFCPQASRGFPQLARKQWPRGLTNTSREAYYVWLGMRRMVFPQAAVPSGESTIDVMQATSRKLVHAGVTKPSRLSIAVQGALQFRKLWRSIFRRVTRHQRLGCLPTGIGKQEDCVCCVRALRKCVVSGRK